MQKANKQEDDNVVRYAAIKPINEATRVETIISFYTNNWKEITHLLTDPAGYMKGQQFLFNQEDESHYVEWELLRPASVQLRCGGNDPLSAYAVYTCLADAIPGLAAIKQPMSGEDSSGRPNPRQGFVFNDPDFAPNLAKKLEGSFYVEFATYTSLLKVVYFPPAHKTSSSYGGGLRSPTLVITGKKIKHGTVHMDIDPDARSRAQFLTSIIQDPTWLIGKLKKLSFEVQDGEMVPPSKPIKQSKPHKPSKPIKIDLPQIRVDDEFAGHVPLTVSGLSDPTLVSSQCHQVNVGGTLDDGYVVLSQTCVSYMSSVLEPHVHIPRVLAENKERNKAAAKAKSTQTSESSA